MKRSSKWLLVHLFLAALLFSSHHWSAMLASNGDYTPFAVSFQTSAITSDETHAYAPLATRFMRLGKLPPEVDNYERRNATAGVPFVPGAIMGSLGFVLGGMERAFIAADVLFPALLLWLFYMASAGLIESTLLRLLLAWTTLLIPFGPRNFLWNGYDALIAPPDITRTPQPELSFALLFIAILLFARALDGRSSAVRLLAAGLAGALAISSYYFYAVAWGAAAGMFLLLAIVWKRRDLMRRAALILAAALVAAIPYIRATVSANGGQRYLLFRMGSYSHAPRLLALFACVLGLGLVWRYGQSMQTRMFVLTVFLLAGLAGLNFQILSGYDAQHDHFWNRLILPLAWILAGWWLLPRIRLGRTAAIVVLTGVLVNAEVRQIVIGPRIARLQRASRPRIELLTWLRSRAAPERVIGALDLEMMMLTPALVPDFIYVPVGLRSLTPPDEIVDRYFHLAYLLGASESEVIANAAPPGYFQPSALLFVLGYEGTAQSFGEAYRRYTPQPRVPARRLDYVVAASGAPVPRRIAALFPRAEVIHGNELFELIDLHSEGSRYSEQE